MDLKIGDWILIKESLYGYSTGEEFGRIDMGPFIVKIISIEMGPLIKFEHYHTIEQNNTGRACGSIDPINIIAKIHYRDVDALFKKPRL